MAIPLIPQWISVANPANISPPRLCGGGMQPLKPLHNMILRRAAVAALICSYGWTVAHRRREEELQYHLVRSWLPSSPRLRGGTATIGEAVSRDIVALPRHKSCLALKGLHCVRRLLSAPARCLLSAPAPLRPSAASGLRVFEDWITTRILIIRQVLQCKQSSFLPIRIKKSIYIYI